MNGYPVLTADNRMNADQTRIALSILDRHFRTLGACDRYLRTGAYVEPRIKRFAGGLSAAHIAVLFGEELTHINYSTFRQLVERACALRYLSILETGSSAHGTNSSLLFAHLVKAFGGQFRTVDLNPAVTAHVRALFEQLVALDQCTAACSDSLSFIASASGPFNLIYLDSYDLLPGRFVESEQHGRAEFETLLNRGLLDADGTLILIDDTPRSIEILASQVDDQYLLAAREHVARHGRLPGKGALVRERAQADPRFEILAWEYQLLLRFSTARARGT